MKLVAPIAAGGDRTADYRQVEEALEHGATPEQVTAVLVASAPIVGSAQVMRAAPKLASALGYDVDAGLEDPETAE
jgi:4-carboxymuconolactone decarboxylase